MGRFWTTAKRVAEVLGQLGARSAGSDPARVAASRGLARRRHELALWTLTSVEARSALQRLVRDGVIGTEDAARVEEVLADLVRSALVIVDVDSVKTTAERLLRRHPLRAADALQLGAALLWAEGNPEGRVFHTFDVRLAAAARGEGFRILPTLLDRR